MDFKKLCLYRDSVLRANNLAEYIRAEQRAVSSPRYDTVKNSNKGTSNPTEQKALELIELSEQLDDIKASLAANLPAAQSFIDFYCADEPEAGHMLKLYFVEGLEPWQVREIAQEKQYKYDTLATIAWLYRMSKYKPIPNAE